MTEATATPLRGPLLHRQDIPWLAAMFSSAPGIIFHFMGLHLWAFWWLVPSVVVCTGTAAVMVAMATQRSTRVYCTMLAFYSGILAGLACIAWFRGFGGGA